MTLRRASLETSPDPNLPDRFTAGGFLRRVGAIRRPLVVALVVASAAACGGESDVKEPPGSGGSATSGGPSGRGGYGGIGETTGGGGDAGASGSGGQASNAAYVLSTLIFDVDDTSSYVSVLDSL